MTPAATIQSLCLKCGLCCNGVIFADVRLQNGDDHGALVSAGLQFKCVSRKGDLGESGAAAKGKVSQPCSALLIDGRCSVYCHRPAYCREFECALLKAVVAGAVAPEAGLKSIAQAHRRAEKVRHLLRELGDYDERKALSLRFRRVKRRFETGSFSEQQSDAFGELTMAVHQMNFWLSQVFYPGNV